MPQLPLARARTAYGHYSPSGWCKGQSKCYESTPGRLTRVHAFAMRSLPHKPRETRKKSLQGVPRPCAVGRESYAALKRLAVACVRVHQRLCSHRCWHQGALTYKADQELPRPSARLCSCCGGVRV